MNKEEIEQLIILYNYNLQGKVAPESDLDILKEIITKYEEKRRKVNNRNNTYNKRNKDLTSKRALLSYYKRVENGEKVKELEDEINSIKIGL